MERSCLNCVNWGGKSTSNPDASYLCNHFHVNTYGRGTCPACKTTDMSDEQVAQQVTAAKKKAAEILATVQPAKAKQVAKRKPVAEMTQAEKDALIAQLVDEEIARSERQLHKGKLARLRIVEPNPNIKMVKLFDHQRAAFDKLKDSDDIALFFEMGCFYAVSDMLFTHFVCIFNRFAIINRCGTRARRHSSCSCAHSEP